MSACPNGFQRINNGCYNFTTGISIPAANASSVCQSISTNTSAYVTHLIAFESLAETIALSFWVKGFK